MQKYYFHNSQLSNENKDKKKIDETTKKNKKAAVDINILLNRVKIEKKSEIKRKIIFFTFIILTLFLFAALIIISK